MHNPENETDGTEGPVTDEVIPPCWPAVLARFTVRASVERLVRKKERELEPDELALFLDAVERRLEELSRYQG